MEVSGSDEECGERLNRITGTEILAGNASDNVHRHSRISRIVKVQLYLTKLVLMPRALFYGLCPPYGKLPGYFESSQLFREEICHLLS